MRVLRRSVGVGVGLAALLLATPGIAAGQQPAVDLAPSFRMVVGKHVEKLDARHAMLSGRFGVKPPDDGSEPPLLTGGSLLLPRGLSFHGGDFPICEPRRFRVEVSRECPEPTVVGAVSPPAFAHRAAVALADSVEFSTAHYVFVNGGPRRISAHTTIYNPTLVRDWISFDISRLKAGRWSHRVTFRIPEILRVVAGVPVPWRSVAFEVDGLRRAPGYLTLGRRCPERGYLAYKASLTFIHNDNTVSEVARRARMRCAVRPTQPGRGATQ
jgi:hypothetical protein